MEESLRQLSSCLGQASDLVSNILNNSQETVPTGNQRSSANSDTSRISSALERARSMLQQSTSRGLTTRLNQRERLRAGNSSSSTSNRNQVQNKKKKQKKDDLKAFEFVVVGIEEDEDDWIVSDEKIMLRGLIEVSTEAKEAEIRTKIGEATRVKFPMVGDSDFVFLRAIRRKLSVPVNCNSFDYKQLKLLAGQGAIYVKLKPGFDCLLVEENDEQNDEELMHSSLIVTQDPPTRDTEQSTETSPGTSLTSSNNPETPCNTEIAEINDIAQTAVSYCLQNEIENPTEILRYLQKVMVYGRMLDVAIESEVLEGTTNFILVDRDNLLSTAFDEIKSIPVDQIRKTLQVEFYGEEAEDLGGPRKEFFRLILSEVYQKYLAKGLKDHIAEDYLTVGKIFGMSILQNGKLPQFMEEEMLQQVFSTSPVPPNSCIEYLRNGLKCLGIYQIGWQLPTFLHLLRPSTKSLTVKQLTHLLKPMFSPEGSNSRALENTVYAAFLKYLREVASGRRLGLSLSSILVFTTGADEEPILGFNIQPSIQFSEVSSSFLPTANTCICCLRLPRPSLNTPLPDTERLFSFYDLALSSTYFGTK